MATRPRRPPAPAAIVDAPPMALSPHVPAHPPVSSGPSPGPSRGYAGPSRPVMLRAVALVVLLHAAVLGAWPEVTVEDAPRTLSGVQVRALAPVPAPPAPEANAVQAPGPAPVMPAQSPPRARPVTVPSRPPAPKVAPPPETLPVASVEPAASAPAEPVEPAGPPPVVALAPAETASPPPAPEPVPALPAPPLPAPPASPASPGGAPADAAAAATGPQPLADTAEPLPVYPARPAPSQTLNYRLRRGLLGGSAVLEWQRGDPGPEGASYRMRLVARAAGFVMLTQESEGGIDAAGLAPRRFTDQRLRGSTRAANFQPGRGRIGFSGPSVEYAWAPGVQDRLSWMLQLPAIVDANPHLASPGERITLAVVGARGDAAVWVFRFVAEESVETSTGERRALRFIRESRKPHDTQAEVWLDPARHHLPLRARIGNPPDGEVLDLLREEP